MAIFEKNFTKRFRYCYSNGSLMLIQKVTIIKCTTPRHCPLQKKKKKILQKKAYMYTTKKSIYVIYVLRKACNIKTEGLPCLRNVTPSCNQGNDKRA